MFRLVVELGGATMDGGALIGGGGGPASGVREGGVGSRRW